MAVVILFSPAFRQTLLAQGTYCGNDVDVTITTQSASDLFPSGGSWLQGTTVNITGTFTINQTMTLDDVDFIMGPGARIIVEGSGVVATFKNGTRFCGCATMSMWYGIQVRNGASIEITSGTRIEDAWIALHFLTSANIASSKIENSFWYDNMTGIYFVGPGKFKPASFSGNTFKRDIGALLPPPPGIIYNGSQLWRGIMLHSANADLASNAASRNEISGYRFGIIANSSTLTIANCTFNGNVGDGVDTLSGSDIFANNSTITVGGSGAQNCLFDKTPNSGIFSRSTRGLSVSGASFVNPRKYGIRCPQAIKLSSPILITGNYFTMNGAISTSSFVAGIYVERPPSGPVATNTLIENNEFLLNSVHIKGSIIMIDVHGKFDATDVAEISNNDIDVTKAWTRIHGIRTTGKGNNYQVLSNDLLWEPSSTPTYSLSLLLSRGITANDLMGSDHSISGKSIVSKLDNSTGKSFLKAGIHLENNPFSMFVCDNRPAKNYYNIYSAGSLGNTRLKKNLIGDAAYGLYCKSDADMQDQDRFENRWTGATYVTRGAEYQGGAPGFKIYYDPSSTINDDKPNTVLPSSGWFFEESVSNNACGLNGGVIITEKEREFIEGTASSSAATDNWDTRRLLLYKLMRFPELTSEDEDAANYLHDNETANTSAWRFAHAEHLFDQAYALSAPQQTAFANMSAQFRAYVDTLALLDAQQAQDMSSFDPVIAQQRSSIFDKIVVTADSLEQLRVQANPGVQQALQTALTNAQNLPDAQAYEDNLKDILTIAIRYAQGDSLLGSDYNTLHNIATQCPATGGLSVRRAPLWLEHEEGVAYLDKEWDDNCASLLLNNKEISSESFEIKVVPSPANSYTRILLVPDDDSGTWQLSDLSGRVVQQGDFAGASEDFNVSGLPNGFYLLTCRLSTGAISTAKLSICH
jgi:hypothetical protein